MLVTQRQEVIVCITKEGKYFYFFKMKNGRPITLLNTVYKIASSCIAARLKTVLPKLIGDDQRVCVFFVLFLFFVVVVVVVVVVERQIYRRKY